MTPKCPWGEEQQLSPQQYHPTSNIATEEDRGRTRNKETYLRLLQRRIVLDGGGQSFFHDFLAVATGERLLSTITWGEKPCNHLHLSLEDWDIELR